MTALASPVGTKLGGSGAGALHNTLAEMRRRQPLFYGSAAVLALAFVPTLAAFLIDGRTLYGVNVWMKPLKFELSLVLFFATLAWFWGYLAPSMRQSRFLRGFAAVSVAGIAFEMAYMILQSGRGVGSHFNTATPIESLLFTLMGLAALVFTAFPAALGMAIAWRPAQGLAPAFRTSVVLGLLLTTVLGTAAGMALGINGSHWVGAAGSDAGGLPLFGWSRDGGDLRVAHFFGIHAMQLIPAAGWLVARWRPAATGAVWAVAAALAALTAWTLTEALSGRPFLPFL